MAAGGSAVARHENLVVFVPGGAPGDIVEVIEEKEAPDYVIGRLMRIIEPSPWRRQPPCPYFPDCGGCQWQHLTYEAQLKAKENILLGALRPLGTDVRPETEPIIPSMDEFHYRYRVQLKILTSGEKMRWGFYAATSHSLIDIRQCFIAHPAINVLIEDLENFLSFLKINPSRLGGVDINVDGTGRRLEFILHARRRRFDIPGHGRLIEYNAADGSRLDVRIINASQVRKMPVTTGVFTYDAAGLTLSTGAGVFSQANLALNDLLVRKVLEYASPSSSDTVVDIYSGVGNYSLPLARLAYRVEAVENNPRAVSFGRQNASRYNMENIHFIKKSAHEAIRGMPGKTKAIILNPPRVGAGEIIGDVGRLGAERIIYVSCNPGTLARDIVFLMGTGYRLTRLATFDMFPQTHHLETVALMIKG